MQSKGASEVGREVLSDKVTVEPGGNVSVSMEKEGHSNQEEPQIQTLM